jgi:hypothetical protein
MSTQRLADDAYKVFREKLKTLRVTADLNEATTRIRIIDTLIFDVLGWDKLHVETEKYTRGVGYLDYIFGEEPKFPMVLEAKRDGTDFVLPDVEYPPEPVPLSLIAKECPEAAAAIRQAHGYANQHGARYSAITNGRQWLLSLTFVANHSVEERLVFVFESLDAIDRKFRLFHECFSQWAIDTNLPKDRLLDVRRDPAPPKLSTRITGYPLQAERSRLINNLRGAIQLVWDEVHFDLGNEVFLQECYIVTEPSEDMLRVARELIEQRVAIDEKTFASPEIIPANKNIVAKNSVDFERPIVLSGRIGSGKSTFLKYLRNIEAKEILKNRYIQIDLDFLDKPASADAVAEFILDQVESQLKNTYDMEIRSDALVRHVLRGELKEFHGTPRGKLLSKSGREAELEEAEVEFIEQFIQSRERYLGRLMKHIRHSQGKSIAIFFDNLDRRLDQIQEQAFLRASAIAAEWSSLVFVCLRPSTVKRSQARGVLDTIAPRVIVVSPPQTVPMLRKRFQYAAKFARHTLPEGAYSRGNFSAEIESSLPKVSELFDVCDNSLHRKPALAQQYEAVANGNVRMIVKYVRDMLTGNHIDSAMILDANSSEGYILSEEETLEALMFGRFIQYDPTESLFVNLFDINRANPPDHFSRLFLLEFCHRHANAAEKYGFITISSIHAFMSNLGYAFDHISEIINILFLKKCIEGRDVSDEATELGDEIRITSLGSYHVTKLVRKFAYLDAMTIDTPILDEKVRREIQDVRGKKNRVLRSRAFLRYLNQQANYIDDVDSKRLWEEVSSAIAHDITDVEKEGQAKGWN